MTDENVRLPDWPAMGLDVRLAATNAAQDALRAAGVHVGTLTTEEALCRAWKAIQAAGASSLKDPDDDGGRFPIEPECSHAPWFTRLRRPRHFASSASPGSLAEGD